MWNLAESGVTESVNCYITLFWKKKQLIFVFQWTDWTDMGLWYQLEKRYFSHPLCDQKAIFIQNVIQGSPVSSPVLSSSMSCTLDEQPSLLHPPWRAWGDQRQASHQQVPIQVLCTMSSHLHVALRDSHIDMKVGLCCFGQWYYIAPC